MLDRIETIKSFLNNGFERSLFDAAINNLNDKSNPLRFNNFAYAMRELVRHVLSRVSPSENVEKCAWYKNEIGEKGKTSRRERITYAIQGGLANNFIEDSLGIDAKILKRKVKDVINNLSKHTHVDHNTFNLPELTCEEYVEATIEAIFDLIDTIQNCKSEISNALHENIHNHVVNEAIFETIVSIDELATHHSIEEVYVHEIRVVEIDEENIHIIATGSIGVQLQWGSNSDLRNDIGATIGESFPMSCELTCSVNEPTDFIVDTSTFSVDTSSWYDGNEDEYD